MVRRVTHSSGSRANTAAIASRCFSPPDSVVGSRRSKPARPTAASARSIRWRMARGSTPSCSRPKTTSSSTLVEKSCASKSWKMKPTRSARSRVWSWSAGRPSTRSVPRNSAGFRVGTMRFEHLRSVDLPAPLGPKTATISPRLTCSETPASARAGGSAYRTSTSSSASASSITGRESTRTRRL